MKIDTISEKIWSSINRPCETLDLKAILEGVERFSKVYKGTLTTETMLVDELNTQENVLIDTADFLKSLSPDRVYISIPVRPPAESWVKPPSRETMDLAYMVFRSRGLVVHMLVERELGDFNLGSDPRLGVISILRVHPMRKSDLERTLKKFGLDWSIVESLEKSGEIEHVEYGGEEFFRAVR